MRHSPISYLTPFFQVNAPLSVDYDKRMPVLCRPFTVCVLSVRDKKVGLFGVTPCIQSYPVFTVIQRFTCMFNLFLLPVESESSRIFTLKFRITEVAVDCQIFSMLSHVVMLVYQPANEHKTTEFLIRIRIGSGFNDFVDPDGA
jgi:hypothetical protein